MGSRNAPLQRKAAGVRPLREQVSGHENARTDSRSSAGKVSRAAAISSLAGIPIFAPDERASADLRLPLQRKLAIGAVNDPMEAEADAMAANVMSGAGNKAEVTSSNAQAVRRKCSCAGDEKCDKCKEEKEGNVQRKAAGTVAPGEAPPIVHEVLRSTGQPLDAATRAFMEPHFGRDLSGVRVHADDKAAESAEAVQARAFTVGQKMVFGRGEYAPQTSTGRQLLAHELTHTIQQGFAPASRAAVRVMRQPAPDVGSPVAPVAAPAVAPEVRIRQWLDQHQFAPPEKQPAGEKEERHVLLNGEEMTVSEAVKLAATALSVPPELVNSVITNSLAAPIATSAAGLPFIGPKNELPGISLTGTRDAFGVNPAITKTVEISTIDDFLTAHNFTPPEIRDPTGDRVLLDGQPTTVEEVADQALAALGQYPMLKRTDVITHIRQKYVAARGGPGNQIVLGYTLVPAGTQFVGGPPDPRNAIRTQHQFSFTITRQHHANDSPGFESSFQGSVTLTDQGILNVQAGGQEAIVKPLLQGWIQVSGLIQVMASENWSKSASGTTVISPAVQATGGGQILLTPTFRSGDYTFLNGHVQLGIQVLGGVQESAAAGPVGVVNAGLVLNIPFSL
jgi:hypothetical protein